MGRTPEYLGKKIESYEVKMASLGILIPAAAVKIGTAVACLTPAARDAVGNPGPHAFSEMLYAFASFAGNNGPPSVASPRRPLLDHRGRYRHVPLPLLDYRAGPRPRRFAREQEARPNQRERYPPTARFSRPSSCRPFSSSAL